MKQILLFIICCVVYGISHAQVQSGNAYIGGTLGGGYNETTGIKMNSFNLKPVAGRFVTDNWMLGLSASYNSSYRTNNHYAVYTVNNQTSRVLLNYTRERSVGVGPVARYYQEIVPKLAFFAEGTAGYARTVTKRDYTTQTTDENGAPLYESYNLTSTKIQNLYAGFAPGVVFFPKAKLGIELKTNVISYTHGIGNGPNQDPITFMFDQNTQKNLNVSFSLASTNIGVGYYF